MRIAELPKSSSLLLNIEVDSHGEYPTLSDPIILIQVKPLTHNAIGISKIWELKSEKAMIREIISYLIRCEEYYKQPVELIGYNLMFDVTQIIGRGILLGLSLDHFNVFRRAYKKDLMQILMLLSDLRFRSLLSLAYDMGVPLPRSGREIPRLYREGRYDEIQEYILAEILAEEELWLRLNDIVSIRSELLWDLYMKYILGASS